MMIQMIKDKAGNLFPGYFALVMATGALSIALYLLGYSTIATGLLWVNTVAYIVLWILTFIRLFMYYPRLKVDLISHEKGPAFFTLVAGTNILGCQFVIVEGLHLFPIILWVFGILLWLIIMYTFFTAVTIRQDKPNLSEGFNGSWLIIAVGTQSLSVLGTLLTASIHQGGEILLFFSLCMYFLGSMLYLIIITLVFYRFTFIKLDFSAYTPPYWINMGAVAITTLAGATLILHADQFSLLNEVIPFLKGFTLLFWITGTWWIPLLIILMIWRHYIHRYPLTYDPQFWGMAFPLAMYTTSTIQLSKALELPFLMVIPHITIFIALFAWMLIFIGFLYTQLLELYPFKKNLYKKKML